MPIFEYKCDDCGREFEELVFDQDETPACPRCGSEKTGKLMSCCRFKSGGASAPGEAASTTSQASSGLSAPMGRPKASMPAGMSPP